MSFVNGDFFNYGANGSNFRKPKCATAQAARIVTVPYQGWSSWKNNVSGNFDRQVRCAGVCNTFKGLPPNAPGMYRVTERVVPAVAENTKCLTDTALRRQLYRDTRMADSSRCVVPGYYNYMDYSGRREQGFPPLPVEYVKGWWPDETASVFNV